MICLYMMSRSPFLHFLFLYLPFIFQALPSQRDTFFWYKKMEYVFLADFVNYWWHVLPTYEISRPWEIIYLHYLLVVGDQVEHYVKGLGVFLLLFTNFFPPPKIINKHFTWSCSPSIGNNLRKANLICSQNLKRCLCEFFCQNLLFLNQLSLAWLVYNSNISLQVKFIAVFIFCNSADFLLLFSCS